MQLDVTEKTEGEVEEIRQHLEGLHIKGEVTDDKLILYLIKAGYRCMTEELTENEQDDARGFY